MGSHELLELLTSGHVKELRQNHVSVREVGVPEGVLHVAAASIAAKLFENGFALS